MGKHEQGAYQIDKQQDCGGFVADLMKKDPLFVDVFSRFPWLAVDLTPLHVKSEWKYDHSTRVVQIGLDYLRRQQVAKEQQIIFAISGLIHDIAMVDDDLVHLTNSQVSLSGEPLRFLITEHPRRVYERYIGYEDPMVKDAATLAGVHNRSPKEIVLPEALQVLHRALYLGDQVDARMSIRPYRTPQESQTAAQVLADDTLLAAYSEDELRIATGVFKSIYKPPHSAVTSLPKPGIMPK
jgi:HD superfamily phosphohydrolase YqeK